MIAVTLTQPWASLIAYGEKRLETRTWKPNERHLGTMIAIHAAKSLQPVGGPAGLHQLCMSPPFKQALEQHNDAFRRLLTGLEPADVTVMDCFPFGAIVAEALLEKVVPADHAVATLIAAAAAGGELRQRYVRREMAFGGYSAGRWAWVLRQVHAPERPIACRGGRGLWEMPDEIAQRLAERAYEQGRDHA